MKTHQVQRRLMLAGLGAVSAAPLVRAQTVLSTTGRHALVPPMAQLAAALAAPGQLGAGLAALDNALAQSIGHKLFTVLVLNWDRNENQRYYTNQPKAYPIGSSKPIVRDSVFIQEVVLGGRPRICRNYEDMKAAFFDHELIRSLGCESAVNFPIRWNGTTIGTLNLLHEAGWYTQDMMSELAVYAAMTVPALQDIVRRW